MSWKCEVKRVTDIQPIPNADKIVVAFLDHWPVVVKKGDYSIGQLASYFPADSIIPIDLLKAMGLEGRLSGSLKNRVKAVRLRGQLSVGLVYKAPDGMVEGDAVDAHFGITKYEPPIPTELSGQCVSRPREFAKYDIDNINDRFRDFTEGEECIATCKIHGCLHESTPILMENGDFKEISKVLPGELVSSYDIKTGKFVNKRVIHSINSGKSDGVAWMKLTMTNGNSIICTTNHKFLTKDGWIEAKNLTNHELI